MDRTRPPARLVKVAVVVLGALGSAVALVACEVAWVVHRRLPSLTGLDVSGVVPGPDATRPIRIVALGDSTLTGPGLDGPHQVWLTRAIADLGLPSSTEVVSLAEGGSRVADVRRQVPRALTVGADVAVVAVGSNDAIHGTRPTRFAAELDGVVAALLDEVPVVAVSNVGDLGNIARVPRPLDAVLRRRAQVISREVHRVVDRHDRAVLLDVTPSNAGFRDAAVFAADLFHPNSSGHALWAAAAVPGLRTAITSILGADADQGRGEAGPRG